MYTTTHGKPSGAAEPGPHLLAHRRVETGERKASAGPVYYLGKADDLLAKLRGEDSLRISSASHGAVAAVWAQAKELGVAEVIDAQLARSGRHISGVDPAAARPMRPP
jgi:hypothetical protein